MIRLLLLIIATIVLFYSCKKDPDEEKEHRKIRADFFFGKACNTLLLNDTVQYIDSIILFKNTSDTGQLVTYKWDFGDKQISTEKSPAHTFSKPGVYPVTLYTYYNNVPSDTFSRNLWIIIGQQEFKGSLAYTSTVDLDEAPDKEVLVLVMEEQNFGNSNYSLLRVDSLLKKKFLKPIPGGSSVRLKSLKRINATEYIMSGNYQAGNTGQFALSKINANGDLIWQKYITNLPGENTYTLAASDGSLITIGNNTVGGFSHTIVVKCDANGDEIWRKVFDGKQSALHVRSADNIIEIAGGYAFAALQQNVNNTLITMIKLDLNGNVTGQGSAAPGDNSTIFKAGVAFVNNTYMVYGTNARYIYMFTSAPAFIDSRQVAATGINHGIAANGNFYIVEGSHQYASFIQLNPTGVQNWTIGFGNSIPLDCSSVHSGVTRYGRKVLYTNYNEVVGMADGQNNPNNVNGWSVYMVKGLPNGRIR
jgi:hypothetical protein